MTYQEKRSLFYMMCTIVLTTVFGIIMYRRLSGTNLPPQELFQFWGKAFLVFAGLSIVVRIVLHILFSIGLAISGSEGDPGFSDERDKIIELRGTKVSHIVFSIGFLLSMAALAFGLSNHWFFIFLLLGGALGALSSELTEFILYRRGF